MISILLKAEDIKNDTEVYMPSGESKYTLKRKIIIHGDKKIPDLVGDDVVFLCRDGSIAAYGCTRRFRIDFDDLDECIGYLQDLKCR